MFDRPKLLHDILNKLLEPRCAISRRNVQVLFVSRNLQHKRWSVFIIFSNTNRNHHPHSPYTKKNNLF
jgi:hypothetical protein